MLYVVLAGTCVLVALCGYIAWQLTKTGGQVDGKALQEESARLKAEVEQKTKTIGNLQTDLDRERSQKDELKGKSRQLSVDHVQLDARYNSLREKHEKLETQIARIEAEKERKEKEFETKVNDLENARKTLDEERQRVIRADQERQQLAEEERDRLWMNHELSVIACLTDLCKHPTFSFASFTNKSLPDGFDGSLQPDFMIELFGQYVIFDAKVSKAKSLKSYIDKQVKETVEKVKGNERIYPWIFLVVPTVAVTELKNHHYIIDGYNLFVVSPEALPAILASLKRITLYEFAEKMDPQERENIIQLIAELDFHIHLRNATDLVLTKMGTDILEKTQRLDPELAEEVAIKKQPMNAKAAIAAADIKKIVARLTAQNEEVERLIAPKAAIRQKDLEAAEAIFTESLL